MPTFVRTDKCDGCKGQDKTACMYICPHDLMKLDKDGAETGLENVPMSLMDGATQLDSTTTDASGAFSFENVPPGDFTLVIDTPPAGTDATVDPDGLDTLHEAGVTLTAGQSLAGQDFGYRRPAWDSAGWTRFPGVSWP